MKSILQDVCAFAVMSVSFAGVAGAADSAEFVRLGCLAEPGHGGCRSYATGVSSDGSIVVGQTFVETAPGVLVQQAFRWTAETGMVALGSLPGGADRSSAYNISGDGTTIVGSAESEQFSLEAFFWQGHGDGMIGLGGFARSSVSTAQNYSIAEAASHDGSAIVGMAASPTFTDPLGRPNPEAFVTWEGELLGLGKLPGGAEYSWAYDISGDGTIVVGLSGSENGWQAFRWTKKDGMVGLGGLPGASSSLATAISQDGSTIVGRSPATSEFVQAFRWTEAEGMVRLTYLAGDVPSPRSTAYAVSADGAAIVGESTSHNHPELGEGFICTQATGMRSLRQVLELQGAVDLDGWFLRPRAISADGLTIVGTGEHPEHGEEAWLARLTHLPVFADLNGDGVVDVSDLLTMLGAWGLCDDIYACPADLNGDGVVDVSDLISLLSNWH